MHQTDLKPDLTELAVTYESSLLLLECLQQNLFYSKDKIIYGIFRWFT